MNTIDRYLERNASFASKFSSQEDLSAAPTQRIAIVACMDAGVDTFALLGMESGDAHIIRNAGGVVTEDVIRSLAVSQSLLGTREIMLIHHTDCGVMRGTDDELKEVTEKATGSRPPFAMETFADLDRNVRESTARLKASPYLAHTHMVRGFVYDVETGKLREVR